MKKLIIYGGLLSILSTCIYADNMSVTAADTPVTATSGLVVQPESAPVKTTAATIPASLEPMNCTYKIPAQVTHVEESVITKWAEKAALQSFDFNNNTLDKQLIELHSCYTEQGWQSFNDALQKSGNLNAIKSQKLIVSSSINGKTLFSEIKNNQWKVTLPIRVLYRNDKEKLTQFLSVDLIIGRKINGDLGIMQMIASPMEPEIRKP